MPDTLVVFVTQDDTMIKLCGEMPHEDFDDDTIIESTFNATDGPGLWAWVDEGSFCEDDGTESWCGHWRPLTADELSQLNGRRPLELRRC